MGNVEKLRWRREEILAHLEEVISDDLATEEELILYENFHYKGKLEKNDTYKRLIRKMKREWDGE